MAVTVVIPVKNEETNLRMCLSKLRSISRILVVDSQSTDKTVTVATSLGAEVLEFNWQGGFPKKRNWVLQNYKFLTDWVLFLDADEQVTEEFMSEMAAAIEHPKVVGYWLNYRNYFMGRLLRHGVPQKKLALFKVGAGFYERIEEKKWTNLDMEVHEHPLLNGPVGEIRAEIEHRDFRDLHKFVDRHNLYSTWEAHRWAAIKRAAPSDRRWLTSRQVLKYRYVDRWWFGIIYFLYSYIFKMGFLDGSAGFNYSLMKLFYFVQIRLKIKETFSESESSSEFLG